MQLEPECVEDGANNKLSLLKSRRHLKKKVDLEE